MFPVGIPPDEPGIPAATGGSGTGAVETPVYGVLLSWEIEEGQRVAEGDTLATMEVMKMETQLYAPCSGRITLLATAGEMVAPAFLATILPCVKIR